MRLLVCGCRWYRDQEEVSRHISREHQSMMDDTGDRKLVVIEGGSDGADQCAALAIEEWIAKWEDDYEHESYQADWERHGLAAGPIRNMRMLQSGCPDRVLAFWDGKSPGTRDMIQQAVRAGVPVRIVPILQANGARR